MLLMLAAVATAVDTAAAAAVDTDAATDAAVDAAAAAVVAAAPGARLVEVGGLKAVLPVFMGRGAARKLRQKVQMKPHTN